MLITMCDSFQLTRAADDAKQALVNFPNSGTGSLQTQCPERVEFNILIMAMRPGLKKPALPEEYGT